MTSPAAANWPGSPGMPRPSPARPGQSPGGHSALHSPEQLKSGIYKILWGQNAKMRIRKLPLLCLIYNSLLAWRNVKQCTYTLRLVFLDNIINF